MTATQWRYRCPEGHVVRNHHRTTGTIECSCGTREGPPVDVKTGRRRWPWS